MPDISEPTEKLISNFKRWQKSLKPKENITTIHVDEVASRVAAFYEKIRGIIDWKEEHGDEVTAMTQTGWVRARQLANGDEISYDIVKRMAAFVRHKKNSAIDPKYKDTPWKDAGYVSYLGWGGDEGIEWAQKIMQSKT